MSVGVRSVDQAAIGIALDHLVASKLRLDHHGVQRRCHEGEMDNEHHEQTSCQGGRGPQ